MFEVIYKSESHAYYVVLDGEFIGAPHYNEKDAVLEAYLMNTMFGYI